LHIIAPCFLKFTFKAHFSTTFKIIARMNKTALITGGAGGIGLEIARKLAPTHAQIILVDRRPDALEEAKSSLEREYPNCIITPWITDLAKPEEVEMMLQDSRFQENGVDTLVNNAGFGLFGSFAQTDWNREDQILHLHVNTLTRLTKFFLPGMIRRGSGKILNISSIAGFQPGPFMSIYYASKAYVLSFSEAIANEVKGSGVSVTVLCPGITPTGFQSLVAEGKPTLGGNKWLSISAEKVARYGVEAMEKGKTIAIPGVVNRILANLHRFLPRNTATQLMRIIQTSNRK
jgi:short-subunit dehydrogenase